MGDSVRTVDILDITALERLINDAEALFNNAIEGTEEGQFEPGSKSVLWAEIQSAQQVLEKPDVNNTMLDSTVWVLADACVTFETGVKAADIGLIDPLATKETKYLFINLDDLSSDFLLFGMHDATGYGVGWKGDDDRSDVKDVCGSFPAVYSEDMNKVDRNREVDRMRYRLTSAYNRGGVITLSWHQYDPQDRGFYSSAVNNENIVATLLPGGSYHQFYKDRLRKIARFLKTLRGANGESIPVIFRPYHEHTGGWFWWGAGQCSREEYNSIWQFTVAYLRDTLNVHNLIYALSPSAQHIASVNDYYNIYPGDEYIDIFGLDNYFSSNITSAEREEFKNDMRRLAQAAIDKGKVAALTEVGQENVTTSNLFTQHILEPVKSDSLTRKMAYAAVWRNESATHHFAPYPGHPSVPDFITFYNDPYTLFEDNLPAMYQLRYLDDVPPIITAYPDSAFISFWKEVIIGLTTNERAFVRYSYVDEEYAQMPYEFQKGQGSYSHSTTIVGEQGQKYHLYIRAADYNGNAMTESVEVLFEIDTLQRPVAWNEMHYNTSDWLQGNAPFHFEDGSSSGTVVPYSRTVYFRKTFDVLDASALSQMVAFVQYDNGFVLYLNGYEVRRVNMPAGTVDYYTWAGNSTQTSINVTLDASVMVHVRNGQNVIAVEVHQSANDSSDLKFDLKLIDPNVLIDYSQEWSVYSNGNEPPVKTLGATPLNRDIFSLPRQMILEQNYPNPFNPSTTIRFAMEKRGLVQLVVYDVLGSKIALLVDQVLPAGWHTTEFQSPNLASGIYFYRLTTPAGCLTRKMVIIQ